MHPKVENGFLCGVTGQWNILSIRNTENTVPGADKFSSGPEKSQKPRGLCSRSGWSRAPLDLRVWEQSAMICAMRSDRTNNGKNMKKKWKHSDQISRDLCVLK